MASLLAAGAGAASGLDDYLSQLMAQQKQDQAKQLLAETLRKNQAEEDYKNRALASEDSYRQGMLKLSGTTKADADAQHQTQLLEKIVGLHGIGDPVSQGEYDTATKGGVPIGLFSMTPGETPEVGPTSPNTITFKGTGAQRQAATNESGKQDARDAAAAAAQQRAEQAWATLEAKGHTQDALNQFHDAQLENARLRLENQKAASDATAAKTPQPQFFQDPQGKTHAVIFDRGEMKEIPLPTGYVPTKAAPPNMWDSIKRMFTGEGSDTQTALDILKNR